MTEKTSSEKLVLGSECPWCGEPGFHADIKSVGITLAEKARNHYLASWCYYCDRSEAQYPDGRTRVFREGKVGEGRLGQARDGTDAADP